MLEHWNLEKWGLEGWRTQSDPQKLEILKSEAWKAGWNLKIWRIWRILKSWNLENKARKVNVLEVAPKNFGSPGILKSSPCPLTSFRGPQRGIFKVSGFHYFTIRRATTLKPGKRQDRYSSPQWNIGNEQYLIHAGYLFAPVQLELSNSSCGEAWNSWIAKGPIPETMNYLGAVPQLPKTAPTTTPKQH